MSQLDGSFKKVKKGEGLWLLSFSDMCLIMLCFFLMLLATMKPDKKKFDHITEGLNEEIVDKKKEGLRSISQKLELAIKTSGLEKSTSIDYGSEGLRIEFMEGILFSSGSAKSHLEGQKNLQNILESLKKISSNYRLIIEGHTDDEPLHKGGLFESNWELSAARGFTLLEWFKQLGVKETQLSVIAYAHTRPKVNPEGLTGKALQKARAENRRVVIKIE
ncbi:MAG: OmpA family protein [Oligoflexales bacterium]|nr:OmpA family protein [Oligoflexales bacterium]